MVFFVGFILGGLVAVFGMSVFIVGSDADDAEIQARVESLVLRLQEAEAQRAALAERLRVLEAYGQRLVQRLGDEAVGQ